MKEWKRLQQCADLGSALAVYALLSSWSKSELDALGQEISEAGEFALIEWAKCSLLAENLKDKSRLKSLNQALKRYQEMLFEISAVLTHYQSRLAQSN